MSTTGPQAPSDHPAERGSADGGIRQRLRRDQDRTPRPWRVERMNGDAPRQQPRPGWWRLVMVLVGLLVVNWIVSSLLLGPMPREKVSYTFFLSQVDAHNVKAITSTADTIEGVFDKKVAYPPDTKGAAQVDRFTTQRPS